MNPITSASIAAFLAVPEILGIALKGIFFAVISSPLPYRG
jgi:hypothetical protein